MDVLHDVGADDCVKIGLHKVENQIDVFIVLGAKDAQQRYDVRMSV